MIFSSSDELRHRREKETKNHKKISENLSAQSRRALGHGEGQGVMKGQNKTRNKKRIKLDLTAKEKVSRCLYLYSSTWYKLNH